MNKGDSSLGIYDLDSYEINKSTCAVINLKEDISKVIEKNNEYQEDT